MSKNQSICIESSSSEEEQKVKIPPDKDKKSVGKPPRTASEHNRVHELKTFLKEPEKRQPQNISSSRFTSTMKLSDCKLNTKPKFKAKSSFLSKSVDFGKNLDLEEAIKKINNKNYKSAGIKVIDIQGGSAKMSRKEPKTAEKRLKRIEIGLFRPKMT